MFNKWILKAIIQKIISFLPYSQKFNYFFQKYVTKGVRLTDEYFLERLRHAQGHLFAYQQNTGNIFPDTTLELGSGWYPVIPVYFFLVGSKAIYTMDINLLTNKKRIFQTIKKYVEFIDSNSKEAEKLFLPDRINALKRIFSLNYNTIDEILKELNIQYIVSDARKTGFSENSFNLIHSNNTFEHIYPEILKDILIEFFRILKPGEIMSHSIDLSDHFSHYDRSITNYNFLRFSQKQWNLIDNCVQPQNRMRVSEYENMFSQLGISFQIDNIRFGKNEEITGLKLDSFYKTMPLEKLLVTHCRFISKKTKA